MRVSNALEAGTVSVESLRNISVLVNLSPGRNVVLVPERRARLPGPCVACGRGHRSSTGILADPDLPLESSSLLIFLLHCAPGLGESVQLAL